MDFSQVTHEKGTPDRLCHDSDRQVVVHTDDYDLFVMTQREVVKILQQHDKILSSAHELRDLIAGMFATIRQWAEKHESVARVVWTPRSDDALVIVIAGDEDEDGKLHEVMSELDLQLSENYSFRVSFLLLRAAEEPGLACFAKAERPIYDAEH